MKKVVMACANYWTTPFQVGSHHIARAFAHRGWEVAFISDPISVPHFLRFSESLKDRFDIYRKGGVQEKNIWAYVPGGLFTPYNYPLLKSSWLHNNWQNLTFPSVVSKLRERGFGEPDLLYWDSPLQAFWKKKLSPRFSIYRVADYNKGFLQTSPAKSRLEEGLIADVDCAIYTADSLKVYVESLHPKRMEFVPNGVDLGHFRKRQPRPKEYQYLTGPIALYVGALHEWFDYDLINAAAVTLPHINFVIIGPSEAQKFNLRSNIHLLGARSWNKIPAYMQHASVGLIPFDVEAFPELIHRVNPLKLYEYMACGLPVVSRQWDELKRLDSPALLATSKEEFIDLIEKAVPSKSFQDFAEKHDWKKRVDQIISIYHSLEKKG